MRMRPHLAYERLTRTHVRNPTGRLAKQSPALASVLVGPVAVRVVELARGVLLVAVGMAASREPGESRDRAEPSDNADDPPDRVRDGGERQPGYFRSTTIVFTDAVTPSATSTTTTYVPTFLIGSSRWTLRLSTLTPRASSIASAMS